MSSLQQYSYAIELRDDLEQALDQMLVALVQETRSSRAVLYSSNGEDETATLASVVRSLKKKVLDEDWRHETVLVSEQAQTRLCLSIGRPTYSYTQAELAELRLAATLIQGKMRLQQAENRIQELSGQVDHLTKSLEDTRHEAQDWENEYLELADYAQGLTTYFCRLTRKMESAVAKPDEARESIRGLAEEASVVARRLAKRSVAVGGETVPVNLNAALFQVHENLKQQFEARNFTLTRCRLPVVQGQEESWSTVLSELLDNAVIHGKRGGMLEVDCTEDADHYHLLFSDDGPGVDTAHRKKIFTPFYKTPKPDNEQRSGLGLFNCSHIVRGWGGEIWAGQSKHGGLAIHLTVPRGTSL
ncbi:MAG: sensor histidine kinase [Candidatus Eremiobacteraeota bacterium]|nr:sensor histidine kinase [Candidatus Eremiobacteraeota bacterium]